MTVENTPLDDERIKMAHRIVEDVNSIPFIARPITLDDALAAIAKYEELRANAKPLPTDSPIVATLRFGRIQISGEEDPNGTIIPPRKKLS